MSATQQHSSDLGIEIIAEAGCNHLGNLDTAFEMITAAHSCGCNTIKFQAFKTDQLVNPGDIKEFCRNAELSEVDHELIRDECNEVGIRYLASAFDMDSLEMLFNMGEECVKIPSGQIFNRPLLKQAALYKMKTYLSTGMCDMSDVANAYGILRKNGLGQNRIVVMQCTTAYPCSSEDLNLNVLDTYMDFFDCEVGFSDHCYNPNMAMVALALGATVFERHFILSDTENTPDSPVSLEPYQMTNYVNNIRLARRSMGSGVKKLLDVEQKMTARKDVK